MTRVLIVGLLGAQTIAVRRRFGNQVDLVFLRSDDSPRRMYQSAQHCAVVIGMVGFLSHTAEDSLTNSSSRYVRVSGALGGLFRVLEGLASSTSNERRAK